MWDIKLIRVGRINANCYGSLLGHAPGEPVVMPMWMAAVTDGKTRIVIDTGIGKDIEDIVNGPEPNCMQDDSEDTERALFNATLWRPEDVDIVINTHLHFDHCGSDGLFKNAKIYIQEKELESAKSPKGEFGFLYYEKYIESVLKLQDQICLVDGEKELFDGIALFQTRGHSEGHQSVMIKTNNGVVCFAGDCVPMIDNITESIPTSIYVDREACLRSFETIRKHADYIIPGHDYRMLNGEAEYYKL